MYSQKVSKGIYKKPDQIKLNMKIQNVWCRSHLDHIFALSYTRRPLSRVHGNNVYLLL
jgi:hypothetical protein